MVVGFKTLYPPPTFRFGQVLAKAGGGDLKKNPGTQTKKNLGVGEGFKTLYHPLLHKHRMASKTQNRSNTEPQGVPEILDDLDR